MALGLALALALACVKRFRLESQRGLGAQTLRTQGFQTDAEIVGSPSQLHLLFISLWGGSARF